MRLRRWTARDSDLKVPLLEVEYFTDDTGAPLPALTVKAVSKLEEGPKLPASLFETPAGLKITEVPFID